MKKTREEKAITLIALIITIVVLLILAVVAINAVTGDGIIQHATNAKASYQNAQAKENSTIQGYADFLENEVTAIEGKVELIKFTIWKTTVATEYEYIAEKGMTWEQWVNSKYNTDGYKINNNWIYSSDGQNNLRYYKLDGSTGHIKEEMVINNGEEYRQEDIYHGLEGPVL